MVIDGDNMKFTIELRCLLVVLMTILFCVGKFVWYIYLMGNVIALGGCRLVFNGVIRDWHHDLLRELRESERL